MTGFWVFMMISALIIPLTMIGMGKLFIKGAPKNINRAFGYRTAMSMKNGDTWRFAHNYCGKAWLRTGSILLPLSIIPMLSVLGRDTDTIGTVGGALCLIQLVPLLASIIFTETALHKAFDKHGNRKYA